MNFLDFQKTTKSLGVHNVSEAPFFTSLNVKVSEPHYLISTSGSQNQKHYLHSLSSISKACSAFFQTFSLEKSDRWLLSLPTQHVGGFSVLARSHFGGLKAPYQVSWNKFDVLQVIEKENISLISLVPAQVFDLVSLGLKAPQNIKCVFVGGAAMSESLAQAAQSLGWPLVFCYGSTETFAQMSFSYDGRFYQAYEGWVCKQSDEGHLLLKGPGLYAYQVFENGEVKLNSSPWFDTKDQLKTFTKEGLFSIEGRSDGKIKVNGEFKNFLGVKLNLEEQLLKKGLSLQKHFVVALKEERGGAGFYLCSSSAEEMTQVLQAIPELRGAFLVPNLSSFVTRLNKVDRTKLSHALKVTVVSV